MHGFTSEVQTNRRTLTLRSLFLLWSCCTAALLNLNAQTASSRAVGQTRTYYVAADEVNWDYAPSGRDEAMGMDFDPIGKGFAESGPHQIGRIDKKAIYRQYTDATFTTLNPRSPEDQYLGILGPILHGEVGDTLKIIFKNNATHPFSMHPHGVLFAGTIANTGFVFTKVKWSINGYIYGNMSLMTMKKGDRVRWYVTTLGDFNNAHTPHWHGNTVLVAGQRTDVLSVTSAQMITADMVPDATGIWLYHCHISDHMLGGMVARYEVKDR